MTNTSTPNPYQTPLTIVDERDLLGLTEVSFRVGPRGRRFAMDQYLLHWHPKRLLFGSLAMIVISMACLFGSFQFGTAVFFATLIGVMLVSAAVYTAMVYQTKRRIHERLSECGLDCNELMILRMEGSQVLLVHSGGTHQWPRESLQTYRTRRGLLICPEPFLFVFVPKKSGFHAGSYNQFVKLIRSPVRNDAP